jgi:tetratricopeptide (TPR) repeat protein
VASFSSFTELLHRFHTCELHVRQGKIATCLISFKEIIDKMPAISMTDKEKKELHEGIEVFLKNLATHKKFKEIFGEVSFGDTDLHTNLEFIKSMIAAQEQEIVQKVEKDEEAAEAQRLEIEHAQVQKREEINQQIAAAVKLIDEEKLTEAQEIIKGSEEIRDGIILHYNAMGMQSRETKNHTEAIKNYSKAISVSPQDENLHYNIARVYFEDGKREKAGEFLGKALKLNPEFKEGKVFYEYLIKLDQTRAKAGAGEKKSGGLFQKLFSAKK